MSNTTASTFIFKKKTVYLFFGGLALWHIIAYLFIQMSVIDRNFRIIDSRIDSYFCPEHGIDKRDCEFDSKYEASKG